MRKGSANTSTELLKNQIGGNGTLIIKGTALLDTEEFIFIQVLSDCEFTSLVDGGENDLTLNDANGLNLESDTIPAGTILRARNGRTIKEVQLSSGVCLGVLA